MIKKYKDKKWLENKYLEKELSTIQIEKIYKIPHSTIYRWLRKHNIIIRSLGKSMHLAKINYCNLSKKAIEWINGELLGDGSIEKVSSHSARFRYGCKYFEYAQYISNTLKSFGIKQSGGIGKHYDKRHSTYWYSYTSHSYEELLHIYEQWYPVDKKVVPENIELTPLTCKQWYIGDGSLSKEKRWYGKPSIQLATCGFTISDVEWLIIKLIKLGFKVMRRKSNNTVGISAYSTKDFLNYIGKCPVCCYQYKFNYGVS